MIFCEGDSLLAYADDYIGLTKEMLMDTDISFSAGVGKTPGSALLALKKAKGLGKKRVEIFMEEPR